MTKIDTVKKYETPEGIALRLKIAGPIPRACAWAIDFLIKASITILASFALIFFKKTGIGILLVFLFLIEWFYPVVFEVLNGSTPGKKTMGIMVIQDNGTPVQFSSSVLRNLIRAADFFPFFYGAGLICVLINKDFKRLGDIAAGTIVVYIDEKNLHQKIKEADQKRPPADLRVNEQRTILDFSQRSSKLTKQRSIELADILSDITGKKGEKGVEELHSYASWLFRGK